jgi:anti-sigma-K factor RskA
VIEHPWRDDAAAYLLGALDDAEVTAFEAHLAECEICREELAAHGDVPVALAEAVPPQRASRELRDRVMTQVRSEAELLAAAGPAADRPKPLRWWRLGRIELRPAIAMAGAVAVIVAGVLGFALGGGPSAGPTRSVSAQVRPSAGPAAVAKLEVRGRRETLRLRRFATPGEGRVYQLWTQTGGRPPEATSVLFTVGKDGGAAVELPAAARRAHRVLVSSEPAGGSTSGRPSRRPVLVAAD